MKEQGGFKSELTGITEGALTPNEISTKFLFFMFQSGGNLFSEVGTRVAICIHLLLHWFSPAG